jgi:hypothetical protein
MWTVGATTLALAAILFVLLTSGSQPSGPTAGATSHQVSRTDSVGTAVRALAGALAGSGLPGDRALASGLDETAAQHPGAGRVAAAQNALSLAEVLLAGGGITPAQYQDVVNTLLPTGATVPTTTTTTTTTTIPPQPAAPRHGPHHGSDGGDGG